MFLVKNPKVMPKRKSVKRVGAFGRSRARSRTTAARLASFRAKRAPVVRRKYPRKVLKRNWTRKKKASPNARLVRQAAKVRRSVTGAVADTMRSESYPQGKRKHGVVVRSLNHVTNFPIAPNQMTEYIGGIPFKMNMSVQPICSIDHLDLWRDVRYWKPTVASSLTVPWPQIGEWGVAAVPDPAGPEELLPYTPFFTLASVESSEVELEIDQNLWPSRAISAPAGGPGNNVVSRVERAENPSQTFGFWVFAYTPTADDMQALVRDSNFGPGAADVMTYEYSVAILRHLYTNVDHSCLQTVTTPTDQQGKETNFGHNMDGFYNDWKTCAVPGLQMKYVRPGRTSDSIFRTKFKMGIRDVRKWYGLTAAEWREIDQKGDNDRPGLGSAGPLQNQFARNVVLSTDNLKQRVIDVAGPTFDFSNIGGVTRNVRPVTFFGILPDSTWISTFSRMGSDYASGSDTFLRMAASVKIVHTRKLTLRGPVDFMGKSYTGVDYQPI